jgi:hypothetical protein
MPSMIGHPSGDEPLMMGVRQSGSGSAEGGQCGTGGVHWCGRQQPVRPPLTASVPWPRPRSTPTQDQHNPVSGRVANTIPARTKRHSPVQGGTADILEILRHRPSLPSSDSLSATRPTWKPPNYPPSCKRTVSGSNPLTGSTGHSCQPSCLRKGRMKRYSKMTAVHSRPRRSGASGEAPAPKPQDQP